MNHLLGKLMKDTIDHLTETLSIISQALDSLKILDLSSILVHV